MLPARRARIAVVGCGSWSLNAHLPALTANPDAEIVAVVEPREDGLRHAAETFGVDAAYRDPGPMLDEVAPDGGQGQTQVTHSAALLFFLTGLRPASVAAFTESFELAVDLVDAVAVRFDGGAIGTVASTGSIPVGHPEQLEYRIFGKDGYVSYDVMEGRATIRGENGAVEELP